MKLAACAAEPVYNGHMKVVYFENWKANAPRATSANPPATQAPSMAPASVIPALLPLAMLQAQQYQQRAR